MVNSHRNEKGVALPLALFALVMLTGLLLAFLSMAGMESEISANLTDVARARYAAEGGMEFAFDQLITVNTNWKNVLSPPRPRAGSGTTAQPATVVPPPPGTYRGVTRQIQAVLQNVGLPPIPGAYSMPGVQAALWFDNADLETNCSDDLL